MHFGRARVSAAELEMVPELRVEYESRGSEDMRRVLEPIRKELESPSGRQNLGIIVEDRFAGPD